MSKEVIHLILYVYIGFLITSFSFSILLMICGGIFKKANKKSTDALIPVYNLFLILKISEIAPFNFLVFLFPLFNIVLIIHIENKLHKLFYTSKGFFIGLIFFPVIFFPLLAYGKHKYKQKPLTESEIADNEIDKSPILLTEEEIDSLNSEKTEEEIDVDSIFKSDIALIEEVEPYKATKVSVEDSIYEELANEEKKQQLEEVEVLDLNDEKEMKEKNKIEIVDL